MSLHGEYDDDNIFSKIIRGAMPCVKVYEDDHVLGFMDVFPQSPGHCLVILKTERARNILEVSRKGISRLTGATQNIAKAVSKALSPDGIVITQFNGASAGQTVFHLHMHIIPRYDGEQPAEHASGQMADMDVLKGLAAKIKSAL